MRLRAFLLALWTAVLCGQDLGKLPAWARASAQATQKTEPPDDADAWVLLQRYEIAYVGSGEFRSKEYRLVKILTERGLGEATLRLNSLGGRTSKIKTFKGWNLRPDGEMVQLSRSDLWVSDDDSPGMLTTHFSTQAFLPRAAVGSLVAFETEVSTRAPMGPVEFLYVAGSHPIRRWELAFGKKGGWFKDLRNVDAKVDPRFWQAWGMVPVPLPEGGFAVDNVAAIPQKEREYPDPFDWWPRVDLRFLDPELTTAPSSANWDNLATWEYEHFRTAMTPSGALPPTPAGGVAALRAIARWMSKELVYKQVYLTPERGWVPETCPEVVRKRYGDCKDLAACFLGEAKAAGFEGFPVLCRIVEGQIQPDQPPHPYSFNHVIAALKLTSTLGLPAEVETPRGRFLLVDKTDRFCPFGYLPAEHRGRRVLICTPQGAQWVTVSPQAVLLPRVEVTLNGKLDAAGTARAEIRVRETGNTWDLRTLALQYQASLMRSWLLSHGFPLAADGTLSDLKLGDPLALDTPFEVRFTLSQRPGIPPADKTVDLPAWGLPLPPTTIQKPGEPRILPIELRSQQNFKFQGTWTLPGKVHGGLPSAHLDGPFRTLTWTSTLEGPVVHLGLDLQKKDVRLDKDKAEAGLVAWKADRKFLQQIQGDAIHYRLD
jgi:hypothetical protein